MTFVAETGDNKQNIIDVAAKGSELENLLLSLNTNISTQSMPKPAASQSQGNPETNMQAQVADYRQVLQRAYPDQRVEINYDPATGVLSGGMMDVPTGRTQGFATPNFDPKANLTAFASIKNQLENESDPGKQINIALNLKRMAMDQQTYNYNQFKSQAEARFAIPDLEAALEGVKKEEALAPNNPGNGIPSDQRIALLKQLGDARTQAREYTKELLMGDANVSQALNLADSVLAKFKLSDDLIRTEALKEGQHAQQQQKNDLLANKPYLDRLLGLLRSNFKPDDAARESLATGIATGKVKIDENTQGLANATQEQLFNTLFNKKAAPKLIQSIKNVMYQDELQANGGDEKAAKANMALVDKIMSADLDKLADSVNLPSDSKRVLQQRTADKASKSRELASGGMTTQQKNETMEAIDTGARKQLVQVVSNARFMDSIKEWKGLIASDVTAQAVLKDIGADKPVEIGDFITRYMNYGKDKGMGNPNYIQTKDKFVNLKNLVASAAISARTGSLLMVPNPDSINMMIDRIAVSNTVGRSFVFGFN